MAAGSAPDDRRDRHALFSEASGGRPRTSRKSAHPAALRSGTAFHELRGAMQHHDEQPGTPARVLPTTGRPGEPGLYRTAADATGGDSTP